MKRRQYRCGAALLTVTLACGLLTSPAVSTPAIAETPAAPAAPSPRGRWLAIGDSISSGFGIPYLSPVKTPWGQNCRRADGVDVEIPADTPALAWPVVAFRQLRKQGAVADLSFTACSGSITDDWLRQTAEAYTRAGVELPSLVGATSTPDPERVSAEIAAAGKRGQRWDLVSFSFGANNINLGKVTETCLNVDRSDTPMTWTSPRWGRCREEVAALDPQIAALTGGPEAGELAQGSVPLWRSPAQGASVIAQLAGITEPGGTILVHGYPQLFADPQHVVTAQGTASAELVAEVGNCDGMAFEDIVQIRSAITELNTRTKAAVKQASSVLRSRNVRVVFIDPNDVFEPEDGLQHGLCSKQSWVNGPFSPGALHPNGEGHQAMGEEVARALTP
ncbi:SGNH/GDSL hydrolase family protein [Gephyromycinifex aptenodytis]|uniref:GDSL-type esterase/lipase family protein n=1 Tax=Gephyromycinifex aptenodytis TaxID=2716227 RepID=UPI0014481659|nr:GDSL-type esterase/lipase family protein [Gephyromycinifex aptenodytis]